MPLAPILLLDRGHAHDAPHGALARVVPQQHPEPLADIQGIRLRAPQPCTKGPTDYTFAGPFFFLRASPLAFPLRQSRR